MGGGPKGMTPWAREGVRGVQHAEARAHPVPLPECKRTHARGTARGKKEVERRSGRDSQSSQVRWAFWQWKQARLAFLFFGPSRVLGWGPESPFSLALSAVRLRLAGGFFFGSEAEAEGTGVVFSEFDEEEGREGWCVPGGRGVIAGAMGVWRVGGAGCMGGEGLEYKCGQTEGSMGERGRVRRGRRSRAGLPIRNFRPASRVTSFLSPPSVYPPPLPLLFPASA